MSGANECSPGYAVLPGAPSLLRRAKAKTSEQPATPQQIPFSGDDDDLVWELFIPGTSLRRSKRCTDTFEPPSTLPPMLKLESLPSPCELMSLGSPVVPFPPPFFLCSGSLIKQE